MKAQCAPADVRPPRRDLDRASDSSLAVYATQHRLRVSVSRNEPASIQCLPPTRGQAQRHADRQPREFETLGGRLSRPAIDSFRRARRRDAGSAGGADMIDQKRNARRAPGAIVESRQRARLDSTPRRADDQSTRPFRVLIVAWGASREWWRFHDRANGDAALPNYAGTDSTHTSSG